ncbi:hypothetical protein C0992_006183 [Termitomyces sp. T32_za158]|nr:hypothetical protein C0992_006183 [Termitomyces sp. T32_za158]
MSAQSPFSLLLYPDPRPDFAVFSIPKFDANEYANAILAGEPYPSDAKPTGKLTVSPQDLPAKEDVSVSISKLTLSIDDVSRQIKNVVSTHHEALLSQAASAHNLSGSLTSVRGGLDDLDTTLDKQVISPLTLQPFTSAPLQLQMSAVEQTSTDKELVKSVRVETSDFTGLSTLKESGDEKERNIAKAALSIAELVSLLHGANNEKKIGALNRNGERAQDSATDGDKDDGEEEFPLRSITAVAAHVRFIEEARTKITHEMESMVLTGLTTLNQSLLASSLQTAYNLRVLPQLVQNLILDLSQAVEDCIRTAFDLTKISKEALSKGSVYPMSVRNHDTDCNAYRCSNNQFTAVASHISITRQNGAYERHCTSLHRDVVVTPRSLVRAVAKNVSSSIDNLLSRVDGLVFQATRDRSAVTLIGPTATPQQATNAQLATCLYQCWLKLDTLRSDHTEAVFDALTSDIQKVRKAYEQLMEPLMTAIRRELSAIIVKLHRIDFGKDVDATSGIGGSSFYMKELVEKLSFIKAEILSKFVIGEDGNTWVLSIVKDVIRTFVMHVSIARPLGESGKLRLTSDMGELEFSLNAFLAGNPQSKRGSDLEAVGDEYRTLRAMR